MRCPNCNSVLEEGALFCQECGARVEVQPEESRVRFCSNCGTMLEPDSIFCQNCGTRVEELNGSETVTQAGFEQTPVYGQMQTDSDWIQGDCRQTDEYRNPDAYKTYDETKKGIYQPNDYDEPGEYIPDTYDRTVSDSESTVRKGSGKAGGKGSSAERTGKTSSRGTAHKSTTNKGPIIAAIIIGLVLIAVCVIVGIKLLNGEKANQDQETTGTGIAADGDDGVVTPAVEPDEDDNGKSAITPIPKETITVTPTPTEIPLSISVVNSRPDVSSYFKVNVSSASATSTIVQEGHDNSAIKAFDGDEVSSWQEGVKGYGIGESITGYFDRSYNVRYIFLKLGNWRDVSNNIQNSRPQTITITCDGFVQQFTFPDEQREFYIELNKEVAMTYINIKIDAVYPGTDFDDTVIADVAVYGK